MYQNIITFIPIIKKDVANLHVYFAHMHVIGKFEHQAVGSYI